MIGSGGPRVGAGRPKGSKNKHKNSIAALAREHGPMALQVLVDVAGDADQPGKTRVSAANILLDRGFGRPHQSMDLDASVSIDLIDAITAGRRRAGLLPPDPADSDQQE